MLNFICLKSGTKYSPEYVNKLYNMVQRHLTVPHRFVCFTEYPEGINPNVEIRALPLDNPHLTGWWFKPYIFKEDHFPKGDINFYMDLDMVIVENIDKLVNFLPGKFVGLRDVGRVFRPTYKKLGSAVMKWPAGEYANIWTEFEKNPGLIKKFHGDQDWVWHINNPHINFYPDEWIRSYKWEIRSRNELNGFGKNSTFKEIRDPRIPEETAVLAFHGYPDIHDVRDPVIVENWK